MTIIGIGLDATDIPRIEEAIARYGDRFVHRIFAAKEAAMKALGTGHTQGVLWRDIEVVRGGGPPRLLLHGGALRRFQKLGATSSFLTITHAETLALAQVLIFSTD
jgi:holo-[acyl-carrier protein] synthase